MLKKEWREKIRNELSRLSERDKAEKTLKIQSRLLRHHSWLQADVIGATVSFGNEIDTYCIIEAAWEAGKRVAVPRCIAAERKLLFYELTNFNELEKSYYGLLEPRLGATEQIHPGEIALLLVPGVVFDRQGFRIGYGGGYYDRFLAAHENLTTCSLCYDVQFVDHLPSETHDVPVRMIITEKEVVAT
ncbi:5-formyltetrahydrofolate cyclo-ligase [Evansella caseinilytica]|uniref:5-formyltetrahydrofolate cyclo-ligase n=1 Tax=Evansella caseinilytica TaxID=1503961 RepID=A0A1H3KQ05_9BACI|nr:5-formyltetrahydrofolate cyclo-ligase [Evansella caseinilytica]SDY54106.1 5-formyltetrahydrofolate cyclo-ligase [Evansella caseinilytica]